MNKWILSSLFLFGLLFADVLLGKLAIVYHWQLRFLLGDVAEFLLLLFVALIFAVGILSAERKAGAESVESSRN